MKKFLSFLLCVCLILTTVISIPYTLAETTDYFYYHNDFESLENGDEWLLKANQGTAMIVEDGDNVLSGNKSLKLTSDGTSANGFVGFALSDIGVTQNKNTRVSFNYKVTVGTKGWGAVGYIGHHTALNTAGESTACYNWANISNNSFTESYHSMNTVSAVSAVQTVKTTLVRNSNGNAQPLGVFWDEKEAPSEVVFDNVTIAEIIKNVSAVSEDEAKGTASVANKETKYTDYAINETAIFTATAAEGYSFAGWYNGDVLVSTKAVYEHTLTTDTTLTAKWKLYEKEYDYKFYDYENGFFGDSFPYSGISTGTSVVSEETENPIFGNSSYKYVFGSTGSKFALLTPKTAENKLISGASYRVSGTYKVVQTTISVVGMNIGAATGNNILHKEEYKPARINIANGQYPTAQNFSGTITTVNAGYPAIFGYTKSTTDAENDYFLFDNIAYAQIIDKVSAASFNDTMGTAAVTNKTYPSVENFAVNETATFTATANDGYYFVGWYNTANELVSNLATYETVVYTDTTLTAKFDDVSNLIDITFDSKGGSEVESIRNFAGADLSLPANPTKEGFAFAGWYTDSDCVNQFVSKVFPTEDITLYAKWIVGSYQDFENFNVTASNPSKSEIVNDLKNSYNGTYSYKVSGDTNTVGRVVIPKNKSEKLSAFAKPGDNITISFKYKLVSGSVNYYPHTSTSLTNSSSLASYTGTDGKIKYSNGYEYYGTNLSTASNEWQTFSHTYTLSSQESYDKLGIEAEKSLGYTILYITAKSNNTELYIDDVMIYKTIDIPINYSTEAVRLDPTNENKPLNAVMQGDGVSFKAVMDEGVSATITYGDKLLTPTEDGIYTIDAVTDNTALSVVASGMSDSQNHAPGVGLNGENLTKYDSDLFMNKVWQGDTVYNEAVMFVNSSDGTVQTTKKLLYPIDDIISVRNAKRNVWYVKGVDFEIENGKLVWLPNGKCPIYTLPLVVPTDENDPFYDPALNYGGFNSASAYYTLEKDGPLGLKLMADAHHEDYTIYVTYKHSKTWNELGETGYTPKAPDNQSYDMQNFYNKLATNEDVNVLVYGASTATGCGATGRNLNYEIFSKVPDENGDFEVTLRSERGTGISAPTFFEQATAELVKKHGNNNNINYYNIAHGGTGASWGAENLATRVAYMNKYYGKTIIPDIIYIKFAGNDVRTTPEKYHASYTSMVNQFKELYPDTTIVMVTGKINNENCYIFGDYHNNVLELEQVLTEIANATPNCIVAKTTSVWAEIIKSKNYEDYLSNNINHANDFWSMVTSQIIVASAEKNENAVAVKTAYNNSAALRSENASSTGKNGLRIYNTIHKDWVNNSKIVEFGSIAIRKARLGESKEFTLDTAGVGKGVAFKRDEVAMKLWKTTEGSYVYTSYLTNIDKQYYDEDYVIRTYAKDYKGNVYYGETVDVSVFQIANAIDKGNSVNGEVSQADIDAFKAFVNDSTKDAYTDWCAENGYETGTLYSEIYS